MKADDERPWKPLTILLLRSPSALSRSGRAAHTHRGSRAWRSAQVGLPDPEDRRTEDRDLALWEPGWAEEAGPRASGATAA